MEAEAAVARKNSGRGAFCGLPNPAPYPEWDQMQSLLAAQIGPWFTHKALDLLTRPFIKVIKVLALLAASLLSCSTLSWSAHAYPSTPCPAIISMSLFPHMTDFP